MRKIRKAFSHVNLEKKRKTLSIKEWKKKTANEEIIRSDSYKLESYQDLVEATAQISFYNQDYVLFFRGQSKDHKDENGNTTIYPKIYRPDTKGRSLSKKFSDLQEVEQGLQKSFQREPNRFAGTDNVIKYKELRWAIAQHYEIIDTPVIDLTHSLHVAASFALNEVEDEGSGVVNIIGLPTFTNTISYYTSEELAILRLLAFGPPKASRLFMQEAYAVSPFPFTAIVDKTRKHHFDFARRLIAKFEIKKSEKFWGEGFSSLPKSLLLPDRDKFKEFLTPHLIDVDAFWDEVEAHNS